MLQHSAASWVWLLRYFMLTMSLVTAAAGGQGEGPRSSAKIAEAKAAINCYISPALADSLAKEALVRANSCVNLIRAPAAQGEGMEKAYLLDQEAVEECARFLREGAEDAASAPLHKRSEPAGTQHGCQQSGRGPL